jgi:hypothetical protein
MRDPEVQDKSTPGNRDSQAFTDNSFLLARRRSSVRAGYFWSSQRRRRQRRQRLNEHPAKSGLHLSENTAWDALLIYSIPDPCWAFCKLWMCGRLGRGAAPTELLKATLGELNWACELRGGLEEATRAYRLSASLPAPAQLNRWPTALN